MTRSIFTSPVVGILRIVLLAALLAGLALARPPAALAASITITTTADDPPSNNNKSCSLREAIRAANLDQPVDGCPAGAGADTIILSAATYTLTIAGADEDAALTGDLDLTGNLTIVGAGSDKTFIKANGLDRVFDVRSSATVTLKGLSLSGGAPGSDQVGGGIRNLGTLTLLRCSISSSQSSKGGGIYTNNNLTVSESYFNKNSAGDGGGIYVDVGIILINNLPIPLSSRSVATIQNSTIINSTAKNGAGIWSAGSLTISNSTLSDNVASKGTDGGGEGGGILTIPDSSLTMKDSTVSGNKACEGGGLWLYNQSTLIERTSITNNTGTIVGGLAVEAGEGTLQDSVVSNNTAQRGGGIGAFGSLASGTLIVKKTTIANNTATQYGGGAWTFGGVLVLTDSQVKGNTSYGRGGGLENWTSTTLVRSTVDGNSAASDGGGINNIYKGQLIVNSSTISYNTSGNNGGRITSINGTTTLINSTVGGNGAASGGGLWMGGEDASTTTIANATISGNSSGSGTGGDGLVAIPPSIIFMQNTILAGNQSEDCQGDVFSLGYNLIGKTTGCNISATNNILNKAPKLGPLQNNGDATSTFLLEADSPAIDAGNPAGCGNSIGETLAADQRGTPRPTDGNGDGVKRCDIGAVER